MGAPLRGLPPLPGLQPGDMAPSPSTPSLARVKPAKGAGGHGDRQGGGNPERWWAKPGQKRVGREPRQPGHRWLSDPWPGLSR